MSNPRHPKCAIAVAAKIKRYEQITGKQRRAHGAEPAGMTDGPGVTGQKGAKALSFQLQLRPGLAARQCLHHIPTLTPDKRGGTRCPVRLTDFSMAQPFYCSPPRFVWSTLLPIPFRYHRQPVRLFLVVAPCPRQERPVAIQSVVTTAHDDGP